MNILAFLLVGLIAGWLAGVLMRGHGFGIIGDIVVGIIGALVGGFLFDLVGVSSYGFLGSLVTAVIGAVALLAVIKMFRTAT